MTFENVTIIRPTQWSVWIGPQQAIYAGSCALTWPTLGSCPAPEEVTVRDVTLRNIHVIEPTKSPGVIIGNGNNPMTGIVFDNVTVTRPGASPWGSDHWACWGVKGTTVHGTDPKPPCFDGGCLPDGHCHSQATGPTKCCSGAEHFSLKCGLGGGKRCGSASRGP